MRAPPTLPAVLLCVSPAFGAHEIELQTLGFNGQPTNHHTSWTSISADGRFVSFDSAASNLVPNDTNPWTETFIRDRLLGSVYRVCLGLGGAQPNGQSGWSSLSADGAVIAFHSEAQNLVAGDSNNWPDVFVHDVASGVTQRVSVGPGGAQSADRSMQPALSADGRYVAFLGYGPDLVAGDLNGWPDVFVYDRTTGLNQIASLTSTGTQVNSYCVACAISGDGRFVAFSTPATNVVPGDTNAIGDLFVRDRVAGTTEMINVSTGGVQGDSAGHRPSFSFDGRYVAYSSYATNLVAGDTNGVPDVFLRDRLLATTTRVSLMSNGSQVFGPSGQPRLTLDGRYVAFVSWAVDLVANDQNNTLDVFVRDLATGTTRRVSLADDGTEGNGPSGVDFLVSVSGPPPSLSEGAEIVAFESLATNFDPLDTNAFYDVYTACAQGCAPIHSYCTAGTSSNGCVAAMSSSGSPSASASSGFTLRADHVEGQRSGLVFYGVGGAVEFAWGGGSSFLCVKSPVQRTGATNSGGTLAACDGALSIDWNSFVATHPTALGAPLSVGERVWAQAWYRDPPSAKSTSLSDGLTFFVVP